MFVTFICLIDPVAWSVVLPDQHITLGAATSFSSAIVVFLLTLLFAPVESVSYCPHKVISECLASGAYKTHKVLCMLPDSWCDITQLLIYKRCVQLRLMLETEWVSGSVLKVRVKEFMHALS